MSKKLLLVAIILALVFVVGIASINASTYNGIVEFTCTTFKAAGTGAHILDRDNTGAGQESLRIDVLDGAGTLLYTLSFTNGLGSYAAGTINETAYGTAPAYNPIRYRLISLAGNGLPEQIDVDATGTCAGLPTFGGPGPGPGIPSGYVLRTIICDTPVYNTPGGSPVGSARVTTGQTWFVNPTPVTAPDGSSWTRIFVQSSPNPYIPTACHN